MPNDIFWSNFKGRLPKIGARSLPQNYAQTATNVDLRSNQLKPIKALNTAAVSLGSTAWRSIYKMGATKWLHWTQDVDVVRAGVVPTAEKNLTYYTGDGYPKQTDDDFMAATGTPDSTADYERLGVTAPVAALTINIHGAGDGVVVDSVAYQYTYVCVRNGVEHESAPSPATAAIDIETGQYVHVSALVLPVFADTGNSVDFYRVYRVASGDTGADYFLLYGRRNAASGSAVTDIPTSGTTAIYDNNDPSSPTGLYSPLGEAISTEGYDPPPNDLTGLMNFKNEMLIGFRGNELCVSEAGGPQYAWNEDNRIRFDQDIVGIGVFGGSIIVGTEQHPYIVTGSEPGYLVDDILPYEQACLSKNGMISTDRGVIYPSPDGLFLVTDTQGIVLTKQVFTKEQWAALTPSTLISSYYDGKYYGFFSGTDTGIILEFGEDASIVNLDIVSAVYNYHIDYEDDTLYLLTKVGSDYFIQAYEGHATGKLAYTWKSGIVSTDYDTNFPFARILGDQTVSATIEFKLYGDGTLRDTITVTDSNLFRVSSGYRAQDWEVQAVASAAIIDRIELRSTRG